MSTSNKDCTSARQEPDMEDVLAPLNSTRVYLEIINDLAADISEKDPIRDTMTAVERILVCVLAARNQLSEAWETAERIYDEIRSNRNQGAHHECKTISPKEAEQISGKLERLAFDFLALNNLCRQDWSGDYEHVVNVVETIKQGGRTHTRRVHQETRRHAERQFRERVRGRRRRSR